METDHEVLSLCKGFNKDEYEKILIKNRNIVKLAIAEYRFILLQRRNDTDINYSDDKENIEKLFIENFESKEYKKILERLKKNNWTIEQAYKKAKDTGRNLSYISRIKNI